MMLLGTQLFADKCDNCIHIRWLSYVARLKDMGGYSWRSAALARLYRCMCWVANRHIVKLAGHNPSASEKRPRVQMWRLRIDLLQAGDFIWMTYSSPDVLQVVHPEVLEPRHTVLWQCVMAFIYFTVIEWHQIDQVLPQFGGVQPQPQPTLNIDFLISKDGRSDDRWFPYNLHRADHILRFVVADPSPSHDFLDWWVQHGKRFLSPEMYLGDPRALPIPVEATLRGARRVPEMDRVDDVSERRRVEQRARVRTRGSQREWRWLDQAMEEGDAMGRDACRQRSRGGRRRARPGVDDHSGHGEDDDDGVQHGTGGGEDGGHDGGRGAGILAAIGGVSPRPGSNGGEWYGSGLGDNLGQGGDGLGGGPFSDYFVGVPSDDHAVHESQT
ncbi:hypothetical protein Ahy_A02g007216 [Arachis hypogaea]|uniref:Aminotransferase-like plant mobile domain-containing protein n=1 Tax=Arachis hypogaea TaxID=3818 RepID=A0A445EC28_ARAHY|nr:hypothetical protein Ahy_A02g007216 [Arachis hypogaea]